MVGKTRKKWQINCQLDFIVDGSAAVRGNCWQIFVQFFVSPLPAVHARNCVRPGRDGPKIGHLIDENLMKYIYNKYGNKEPLRPDPSCCDSSFPSRAG